MRELLFQHRDQAYKAFHEKLVPNINSDTIIGVRVPVLRQIAKELQNSSERADFLSKLPHEYYEENTLHAFFLMQIADFDACVAELDRFLPYVDNWATCDSVRPKCFKKNKEQLSEQIKRWIMSEHTYTKRFAIEMLMTYFLDDAFDNEYPELVAGIDSDEYYVNMMIAWYFATALAKRWDDVFPYIKEERLGKWVQNKTIAKATESYRISAERKEILKK